MVTVNGSKIEFLFYRPQAREMHLVGDFNNWQERELAMTRTSDGYWRAVLHLPAGNYRFRYRGEGRWFTDFAAFGVQHGPFGWDSMLRVPTLAPVVIETARSQPAQGLVMKSRRGRPMTAA